MIDRWAIKAIEDEADRRAELRYLGDAIENGKNVCLGLKVSQILYLKTKWMRDNPGKEIPWQSSLST